MSEQVPAPPAPNQLQDVVNVAPAPAVPALEPVLAAPVAQAENPASRYSQQRCPEFSTWGDYSESFNP